MHAFRLAAGVVALAAVVATTAPAMGHVVGTAADDSISGGPGRDWVSGRAGDDRIWGQSGRDELRGGPGNDLLRGQGGRDLIWPGDGADESRGGGDGDQFFSRLYLQCAPRGPHWECLAELDFLADNNGVPRLVGKFWASICGSV